MDNRPARLSDPLVTPEPAAAPPVMSELRVGVLGGLLAAIGAMSMALYTPAMTEIVHAFATTEAMVKLTLSVYFGGFCLAQLICGPISDGIGRRPTTILFMAIYLAASLLALFSPDIETLLFARFLQGVGAAVGMTISRAIVRDLFTHDASARVMNMIGIVIAIGPALSPTLGGLTLQFFGWHAIFVFMALMGIVVVLLALFVMKETVTRDLSRIQPRQLLRSYRQLLGSRQFVLASLAVGGTTGALYTTAAILPFILMNIVGMSPAHFGIGMMLQTGSYLAGGLLFRRLMQHFSALTLSRAGFVIILIAILLIAILPRSFDPSYALIMLPMGLFAFGIAFIMPVMTSAAMAPFPNQAGAASALMGFIQMIGGLIGGAVAAAMHEPVIAFATLIPAMAAISIMAFVLWSRQMARHAATGG